MHGENKLYILHDEILQDVVVEDDVQWHLTREGEPGKLTFTVVGGLGTILEEGDQVQFYWDGFKIFLGFLFSHTLTPDGKYQCVAYDQLRYLKNQDTIVFKDSNAYTTFRLIADTFGVKLGVILDPGYNFNMVEDNVSGLDMVKDYCDQILINTEKMYVMYDDFGQIMFKDIERDMGLQYLLNQNNSEDYTYTISIDDNTYNKVKVIGSSKKYESAKDDRTIKEWGLLQLNQNVNDVPTQELAYKLLNAYNRPSRKLTITDAFGYINLRAGSWIPVDIWAGTEHINCPLIVEEVTHKFNSAGHRMDLKLVGGRGFVA